MPSDGLELGYVSVSGGFLPDFLLTSLKLVATLGKPLKTLMLGNTLTPTTLPVSSVVETPQLGLFSFTSSTWAAIAGALQRRIGSAATRPTKAMGRAKARMQARLATSAATGSSLVKDIPAILLHPVTRCHLT